MAPTATRESPVQKHSGFEENTKVTSKREAMPDPVLQQFYTGDRAMSALKSRLQAAKDFCAAYPAVLSGYIIYGYLFVAIIRLFLKVKFGGATLSDAYDIFSALPFMWLLAVTLVKVIEIRTKLHRLQTESMHRQEELHLKETQLRTMKEVVRGLQLRINNPLSVVFLYLTRLKERFLHDAETRDELDKIGSASSRISNALVQFSESGQYEVEYAGHAAGSMAIAGRKLNSPVCL
jgi:hypothetical protein